MSLKTNLVPFFTAVSLSALASCGTSAPSATSSGNISLKSAALSTSSTASLRTPFVLSPVGVFAELLNSLVGIHEAYAATVSAFTTFQICNDTLVITDSSGKTLNSSEAGLGMLTFSNSSTSSATLTSYTITSGTYIKQIKITSAGKKETCPSMGENAVIFNPGSGAINITQNTSFTFSYSSPLLVTGNAQTVTLMFGAIVNAMAALGTGLNNSTIQTVTVSGTAQ